MGEGDRQRGRARVGCSGWQYDDWRGVVYPEDLPKRAWFEHYTSLFDTVELNSTFYRLPEPTTVDGWRAKAPPGFVYAVKLGSYATHRKKLTDPDQWLANHLDRTRRLGAALGPTLVQLPPRWRRNVDRLAELLARIPPGQRWAVELRDPSWLHDDVFDVLGRHDVALCIHDLVPDHPLELTAGWTYLRFHGPDPQHERYHGAYGPKRLGPLAEQAGAWMDVGRDVYAYFNNDYDGHAVADATWLRAELEGSRQAASSQS